MSIEEATSSFGIKDGDEKATVDPDDDKYAKQSGRIKSRLAIRIMVMLLLAVTLGALYLYNGSKAGVANPIKLNEPSQKNPSATVSDSLDHAKVVEGKPKIGATPGDDAADEDGDEEQNDDEGNDDEEEEEEEEEGDDGEEQGENQ
jgi:hypothetical protein